jgi:hypothetical protein
LSTYFSDVLDNVRNLIELYDHVLPALHFIAFLFMYSTERERVYEFKNSLYK